MADFMKVKYENPRLRQSEIANQLSISSSTLQRYRNDINMLPPYRISSNNVKKRSKKAEIDDIGDLKRPQMTSIDSETNSNEPIKNKKKLKGGSIPISENIEINEHYLHKILKKQ